VGRALHRIDAQALHAREVDHEAALTDRMTSDAMAPAADRDEQVVGAGELDGRDDVGHSGAADDERRAPVDHAVPDFAGGLVAGVHGTQQLAAHAGPEGFDGGVREYGIRALRCGDL
jgi:hypothetical protein